MANRLRPQLAALLGGSRLSLARGMISLEWVVWNLRGAVLAVPPPAGLVAYLLCRRIARTGEL